MFTSHRTVQMLMGAHTPPPQSCRKNAVQAPVTSDKLFALKAVKQRGSTLGSMAEHLCADEDVVLEAVKQDGLALRFASQVRAACLLDRPRSRVNHHAPSSSSPSCANIVSCSSIIAIIMVVTSIAVTANVVPA